MNALLSTVVLWLSVNFNLPATFEHPRIETVTQTRLAVMRYRGLASDRQGNPMPGDAKALPLDQVQNVMAVYDDARRIIYLPEGWSGRTPAELSVLVHEMVHHLQSAAGMKFECPQVREKAAYEAQEKWLELFGRKLSEEFEIDPLTILVRTNCSF